MSIGTPNLALSMDHMSIYFYDSGLSRTLEIEGNDFYAMRIACLNITDQ